MDSSIESCRFYFKNIFFPKSEFNYKDYIKRLTNFYSKPGSNKYLRYKHILMLLANAFYLNAGTKEEWNYLITELKNFCGSLKNPNYIRIPPKTVPVKIKNKKTCKKKRPNKKSKTLAYLPTGRRRKRFGSGRYTGIASIISGGVNQ